MSCARRCTRSSAWPICCAPAPCASSSRTWCARVRSAGQTLLEMIGDLLDVAKIESGTMTVRPAPFDLHVLLATVRALLHHQARDKGLDLRLTIDPHVAPSASWRGALAAADPGQSGRQRDQVHRRRPRHDRGVGRGDRAAQGDAAHRRARYRHRHPAERAGAHLRALRAGRRIGHPASRRHRARARDRAPAGQPHGRVPGREQHAGRRIVLHLSRPLRPGRGRPSRG